LVEKIETLTSVESVETVILALGMVASRRSRRGGDTRDGFLKDMGTAWDASKEL
jgi:hypothetical protein